MIRFLLDENLADLFREQLERREPTLIVRQVGKPNAPPKGTPDPVLLRWCEENDFHLFTNNRRSMPVHLAAHLAEGRHVPGILVMRRKADIGRVLDDLLLIVGASFEGEYRDRIAYVPFAST